jgi:hypothetical protein
MYPYLGLGGYYGGYYASPYVNSGYASGYFSPYYGYSNYGFGGCGQAGLGYGYRSLYGCGYSAAPCRANVGYWY